MTAVAVPRLLDELLNRLRRHQADEFETLIQLSAGSAVFVDEPASESLRWSVLPELSSCASSLSLVTASVSLWFCFSRGERT